MRTLTVGLFAALLAAPAVAADGDGWVELLKAGPDAPWQKVDKGWVFADKVALAPGKANRLAADPVEGGKVWVNGPIGRLGDLVTKEKFGDCEVHVEFLIAQKSNSGIKFHAVYEIQILDSAGKPADKLTGDDCGGVYPRADQSQGYRHLDKGIPPKVNAARPAGEWQTLDVTFRSPRFDAKGEKTENARIVKATLNGQVIHENQELKTPTGANWTKKETATGPFMLQADHGPVAFRNVKIRPLTAGGK
jgi:hypothetical protein